MIDRRNFLARTALGSVAVSAPVLARQCVAREPIQRTAPGTFYLGLAAYSLRPFFRYMKGKEQKARSAPSDAPVPVPMSMLDFLDYCVKMEVGAAELTSYFLTPGDDGFPTDESLRELRRAADDRSLAICGTAIGNNFTVGLGPKLDIEIENAKRWIKKASVLGAPHVRFFAGTAKQLAEAPDRLNQAVGALEGCAELAASHKIRLGVENHGRLTSDQMMLIMQKVTSPWIGINLDTGNFISDDPYRDLERCVPYALNVQVKMQMQSPDGKKTPADLKRIGQILRDGGYQGYVVLEYEEDERFKSIPRALDQLREALR